MSAQPLTSADIRILRLSVPSRLKGAHGVVEAILDRSRDATEEELPGLVAALESVLHRNGSAASDLVARMREVRDPLEDLRLTEALETGDPCEFRYPAREDWRRGTVVTNGRSSYWRIKDDESGETTGGFYIEHVRAIGTNPWPK